MIFVLKATKIKKIIFGLFLFLFINTSNAQKTISLDAYLQIIRTYHPILKQAENIVQQAENELLAAKGNFDPIMMIDNSQKKFNNERYYTHTNTELKIPTWYGMDVVVGTEQNGWDRLSNDVTLGRASYAGVSVPLLKNLLLDKRRATLKQSKLLIEQNKQDQQLVINELLYEAIEAYWKWTEQYALYTVNTNAIAINKQRFENIKKLALGGDRAAIDTTEALLQVQNFEYLQSQSFQDFIAAGYEVGNYLWLNNNQPFNMDNSILPDTGWIQKNVNAVYFDEFLFSKNELEKNHPKIQSLSYKNLSLQIDKKLKYYNLLPKLDVKYNFLSKGYAPWKNILQQPFSNNFKYGFGFNVPIFQRAAKADYLQAKLKITNNQLELQQLVLELQNKLLAVYNNLDSYRNQTNILMQTYENSGKLLEAENKRFDFGESTLFLINIRENKNLEDLKKLLSAKTKFYKSLAGIAYSKGSLR